MGGNKLSLIYTWVRWFRAEGALFEMEKILNKHTRTNSDNVELHLISLLSIIQSTILRINKRTYNTSSIKYVIELSITRFEFAFWTWDVAVGCMHIFIQDKHTQFQLFDSYQTVIDLRYIKLIEQIIC